MQFSRNLTTENEGKISVIIPVYNTEKYVGRCLDSIIANDYRNLEIICINDGSTDKSLNMLRKYENKDSRIKVINVKNGGVSRARNIGLDTATGKYVCFIDSDDFVYNRFFSLLYYYMKTYDAAITACKYSKVMDSNIDYSHSESPQFNICVMSELLGKKHSENIWAKLYKRNAIADVRFPTDIKIGEDTAFIREVIWKNKEKTVVEISEALYYYFQYPKSAMHSIINSYFRSKENFCLFCMKKAEGCDDNEEVFYWLKTALETSLGFRYNSEQKSDKDSKKRFDVIAKQSLNLSNRYKVFSLKKRIFYNVLVRVPLSYRIIANFNKMKEHSDIE